MIIFKDKLGEQQDELFTDIYPMETVNEIIYKVKGKLTTETTDDSNINIGGNASAEEPADEGTEASSVSGINVCLANRLCEFPVSKGAYKKHIKDFMGRVCKKMEEEGKGKDDVDCFKKNAQAFVMNVIKEFDEYQFFVGEHMNEDGMMILCKWDGETPYLYFFKHGLEEEKC